MVTSSTPSVTPTVKAVERTPLGRPHSDSATEQLLELRWGTLDLGGLLEVNVHSAPSLDVSAQAAELLDGLCTPR